MKKIIAFLTFCLLITQCPLTAKEFSNMKDKENNKNTIRLIYPQWQGGNVSSLLPDLSLEDSSTGYYLGAQLLNFLAPQTSQKVITVPVSKEYQKREVKDGVMDRDVIWEQTKKALEILKKENPEKIVILGGECSISVVPFTYLAKKYEGKIAVVWIDAHPDITLPGDPYDGYHAMAVSAMMGEGDKKITSALPYKIDASKILFVGLRDWERDEIKQRQKKYGIKHMTPSDLRENKNAVNEWIKQTGAEKVLIHFDMDVLDPAEIIPAVGIVPDGMKISEVTDLINNIARDYSIAGLTVAEPMPRIAIKLKNMLKNLPLLK